MEAYNERDKHRNRQLPDGIPTTEEAERSELSERLDRQIIKDHLQDRDTSRPSVDDSDRHDSGV